MKKPPHNRKALAFTAYQPAGWKQRYSRTLKVNQSGRGGAVTVRLTVPGSLYADLDVYLTDGEIAGLIAMLGKALVRNIELLK